MTESEAAMYALLLWLTETPDQAKNSSDLITFLAKVSLIALFCACMYSIFNNRNEEAEEEKRKQYLLEMKLVEDKAAEFEKSEFIGALAERVRASEKEHTVIGITVEKSRLCLTFGDHTKQFVSYGRLAYGTLRENSLVPVACQLLLELGSGYRIVTKEGALTPALCLNDIILKDPNPQPQKPK